jgi:hypothetical protein
MIILFSKEKLISFLEWEKKAWENIGGGANPDAYYFDVSTMDHAKLEEDGYYDNIDAWIAGVQLKAIDELIAEVNSAPEPIVKF